MISSFSYSTFFVILLNTVMMIQGVKAQPEVAQGIDSTRCLTILKDAMQSGGTFIIRVHAAEALINHHHTEGIFEKFSLLIKESPSNLYGGSRVLARLSRNEPEKYQIYIKKLVNAFLHADSLRGKLIALESLAKLGYNQPLDEIRQHARSGEKGLKGMARWVLANSGRAADEASLAALLTSKEGLDYRYGAYSLRFFKKIHVNSYTLLQKCNKRIPATDPAKVYILSSLFVHADAARSKQAKINLLDFIKGMPGERYEVAEALAIKGTAADREILNRLLDDNDMDVRVAASNALLMILQRSKTKVVKPGLDLNPKKFR